MYSWLITLGVGLLSSLLAFGVTAIWPDMSLLLRVLVVVAVGLIGVGTLLLSRREGNGQAKSRILSGIKGNRKIKTGNISVRVSGEAASDILTEVEAPSVELGDVDVKKSQD